MPCFQGQIEVSRPPNCGLTYEAPFTPLWFRNAVSWLIRRPETVMWPIMKLFTRSMTDVAFNFERATLDRLKARSESYISSNDMLQVRDGHRR